MNLESLFEQQFGEPPQLRAHAPGRVNLLGEHIDYNDGIVLPAAIDRAVSLAASPTTDGLVSLYAADLKKTVQFRLADLGQKLDLQGNPLSHFAQYPAGVAWALQANGLQVSGLQAVYTSDVPIGAGLSSSAAVEVAFGATWRLLGGWQANCLELARLCKQAENQYVGVASGLMDQFASACGVQDHLLVFDTRSLEWYPAPLPQGTRIVVADSGMRRTLSTSAYNERRAACEQALEQLKKYLPNIRSLRDVSSVEFAAYAEYLSEEPRKRAEHVVKEIARVEQAVRALERQDARMFGGLMYATHISLRNLFEVSLPELDLLVDLTRQIPGCYGARLTGAGFGGCTVNLVDAAQAEAFIERLGAEYQHQSGRSAAIYLCRASDGVSAEWI